MIWSELSYGKRVNKGEKSWRMNEECLCLAHTKPTLVQNLTLYPFLFSLTLDHPPHTQHTYSSMNVEWFVVNVNKFSTFKSFQKFQHIFLVFHMKRWRQRTTTTIHDTQLKGRKKAWSEEEDLSSSFCRMRKATENWEQSTFINVFCVDLNIISLLFSLLTVPKQSF